MLQCYNVSNCCIPLCIFHFHLLQSKPPPPRPLIMAKATSGTILYFIMLCASIVLATGSRDCFRFTQDGSTKLLIQVKGSLEEGFELNVTRDSENIITVKRYSRHKIDLPHLVSKNYDFDEGKFLRMNEVVITMKNTTSEDAVEWSIAYSGENDCQETLTFSHNVMGRYFRFLIL